MSDEVIIPTDVGFYVDEIGQPCPRCGDVDQTQHGKCLTCSGSWWSGQVRRGGPDGMFVIDEHFSFIDKRRVRPEDRFTFRRSAI